MTEQDKNYVIEGLEYALHKCIDVNGDIETQYNTLVNAIELVKNCSIPDVVGQSEQLLAFHKWYQQRGKLWRGETGEEVVKDFLSQ